ncbi:MAG: Uma2 family endonuclease [Eubacterium sp.]|nr:Uma2 family endonuclease [Eubacterium sp.]
MSFYRGSFFGILSPSNRMHDKVRKLLKYRKAGVREYWIIDPENREVLVYLFAERDEPERYSFEDIIPIGISEGHCKVDFAAISRSIARFY